MTFLLSEPHEQTHNPHAGAAEPLPTLEAEHPWLGLLYAFTIVATIAICALLGGCGGGDPDVDDGRSSIEPEPARAEAMIGRRDGDARVIGGAQ